MNKYYFLLTVFFLLTGSASGVPRDFQLKFNGELLVRDVDLTVLPGLPNVLSMSIDLSLTNSAGYNAIVKKTLPDGTAIQQEACLLAGDSRDFQLGPMTAPPRYIFEAGAVYRDGYMIELAIKESGSNKVLYHKRWSQGLGTEPVSWRIFPVQLAPPISAGTERFVSGGDHRVPYNPKLAVEAALGLRLDESVLVNQDDVRVLFRLAPGSLIEQLACRLQVTDSGGTVLLDQPVRVERSESWQDLPVTVADWPAGNYNISLYPELDGQVWSEGPVLEYRRRDHEKGSVRVSPVAPWTLQRDFGREEVVITDFRQVIKEFRLPGSRAWTTERVETGSALVTRLGREPDPFELSLSLEGLYAVFAVPHAHGCYLQVGDDPLIRPLAGPLAGNENNGALAVTKPTEIFITIADLTSDPVRVLGPGDEANIVGGLASLRLTPVTRESVEVFRTVTTQLPVPLIGVNDWGVSFVDGRPLPARMERDQYDMIFAGQAEIGLRTIDWDVGRSCVYYDSKLPDVPRVYRGPPGIDPLSEAFRCREQYGTDVKGWHAMMYYGTSVSEARNRMFQDNPQYRRWKKNATAPDEAQVGGQLLSFYFPEIRRDKVDVLLEVAGLGSDGVLVGTIRLPEVMCYHPDMVAEYSNKFGVDPLHIDASNQEEYTHWITWRADFFTQLLRELREGLKVIEADQSRRIPLAVRLPSAGLHWNLAQGMDLKQWLREGLVDQLQVTALENRGGRCCNTHDIRPYIDLARGYGVPVVGGLGATWFRTPEAYPVAMRRALGLLQAGVDGIEFYETSNLARCSWHRWITPLFGHPELLGDFLAESNLEACHPVTARTALYGYDNHSRWFIEDGGRYVWDIYGFGEDGL